MKTPVFGGHSEGTLRRRVFACDAREFSTGAIPEQQFSTLIPYMVKTFGPKSYVIAADYKCRPAFG